MSYEEVLAMPVRSFWNFCKNMGRIRALEDMRAIDVAAATASSEVYEKVRQKLEQELGDTVKAPPKPIDHTAGISQLKRLSPGS